jgi:anti-sigma factor RsiW
MNCMKARSRLSVYQDGELELQPSRALESHLESCAFCRAELNALKQTVVTLRRLTPATADAGFSARIMAGLRTRPEKKLRLLPSLAYTLALLAICIGGFLLEISANGQPAAATQTATTFSSVLSESRNLGLLAVQDSTLELFSGANDEK